MAEEYGIHVKTADGPVEVLKPGIDRRVTALEAANKEQDTAISNAQTTADEAKGTADGKVSKSGDTMTGELTNSAGFVGPLTGNVTGNCSGNAATATKLSNTVLNFSNGTQIWVE